MKKTICEWKEVLKTANEDLKQSGYRLSVNDREERGFFKCVIYKGNKKVETYAENYYAHELLELINEAWSYVKHKTIKPVRKERQVTRIAIIDHDNHRLLIEDVDTEILEKKYNGEEEDYIRDNYELGENWEWEWVVVTEYYPVDDDPIEVEFSDLV